MKLLAALLMLFTISDAEIVKLSLVIGNNIGLANEKPLKYAVSDAKRVSDVFNALSGVDKDRSYLCLNKDISEVEALLQEVSGRVKEIKKQDKSVQLTVYYSGHGGDDGFHMNGKTLEVATIRKRFEEMDADLKILIADACFSGALLDEKGGRVIKPATVYSQKDLNVKGSIILTSSSAGEFSHESKDLKGSLFTHYFISGLRGAADYDRDSKISLWECYHFARVNTLREAGESVQNPSFDYQVQGTENPVLANMNNGNAFVKFKECSEGLYRIVDTRSGILISSIRVLGGDSASLALPRSTYQIHHTRDKGVDIAVLDLTWGGTQIVNAKQFRMYPADVLVKKGYEGLKHKPSSIRITGGLREGFNNSGEFLLSGGIAYEYSTFTGSVEVYGDYSSDKVTGTYFKIDQKYIQTGLAGRYWLMNKSYWRLHAGAQVTFTLLEQKFERQHESELITAGYPPMPTVWGHIAGAFLLFGGDVMLPLNLDLGAEASFGINAADNGHGATESWIRFPVRLWVGYRF
ncbi:MAG: caspase family protein [Fibrobacteres bacterium]|nr:caspase family protein [Fibrobacterota bacterium]